MKNIIVANWKMNPQTIKEAKRIFNGIKKTADKLNKVETVVCPPFVYLFPLGNWISTWKSSFQVGAQDVFWQDKGSYTGEISAKMLKDSGVKYAIIGHSERREIFEETNEIVNKKIKVALKEGLKVILCVGEKERDLKGKHLLFIKEEIKKGLKGIERKFLKNLIIAYEPIWAIGKSSKSADTPDDVSNMIFFIKKVLEEITEKEIAARVPILYGGSVNPENAESFLRCGAQGLLVGHESLIPKDFNKILKIAEKC